MPGCFFDNAVGSAGGRFYLIARAEWDGAVLDAAGLELRAELAGTSELDIASLAVRFLD